MNRTILAIATALLSASTLFASAAQACISCEYVPEVTRTHERSHAAKSFQKKRAIVAAREIPARASKKRPAKIATAKAEPVAKKLEPKKIDTAKADPVETPKVESKPIETATLTEAEAPTADAEAPAATEEPQAAGPVTCKKFIATAGVTITVPCE